MEAHLVLKKKYEVLGPLLDERSYRLCLAADARALGYGGISRVAQAAGVSRTTVHAGLKELELEETSPCPMVDGRIRRPGAGRKPLVEKDDALLADLDRLVDPATRGDPMSPLRWTSKSTPKLTAELRAMGHVVSQPSVWRFLDDLGYSMQSNRKTREGSNHPDRNAQFEFIAATATDFLRCGDPVISVDAKKKENVGNYKNPGREWRKKGEPEEVEMHDFVDKELGKALPYGVYDLGRNEGWVSVGITHDTAQFAVGTIGRWWERMGRAAYPRARRVGLEVQVRHFPPGTSKWNKIEHRMFCHITENWRGWPLTSLTTIVSLIGSARTVEGLTIRAELDEGMYETGRKISDAEFAALPITHCDFHGEWNYYVPMQRPECK